MEVKIRDFDVDMTLGNKGFILSIKDNDGTYRGKLRIGKARVEWCRGKTQVGNGTSVNWDDLIEWFEDDGEE